MGKAWTQITVTVKTENLNRASEILSLIDPGLMIEDFSDFSLRGMYGELVDESILNADLSHGKISMFVPEERDIREYSDAITMRLENEGIEYTVEYAGLSEDDWADSWKKHFKPIRLGCVTVAPTWEEYTASPGECVIRLDPGMAFGTGTHETTRLVIGIMQGYIPKGGAVLDVGCGSGILSMCAAQLGAGLVNAYDIDPMAVKVAADNAEAAGLSHIIKVDTSDLLSNVERVGGYDMCLANIVPDIIVKMLPNIGEYLKPGAPLILSGIVREREDEVLSCAEKHGYHLVEKSYENDWVALMVRR